MTSQMTSLIFDAHQAGYDVFADGTTTLIVRRIGRREMPKGLRIYDDGTAIDLSVGDLGVAKGIRSYKDMRAVLGLNQETQR